MSRAAPITDSCANTGHFPEPRYTSPCCYVDLTDADIINYGTAAICPECDRNLKLSVEKIPSYVCELMDPGAGNDG